MVTRVGLVQSGNLTGFATSATSSTFNTQVGDLVLVFTRFSPPTTETVSSVALSLGGSLTAINVTNISTRNTSSAWYRVITTAQTGDSVVATLSGSVSNRVLDVVIYRPGAGFALSFDTFGVATTSFTASVTTSAINTTGGGVLCTFVSGSYVDFLTTSVSAGYTKFGTDTAASSIAEKFSATAVSSETVTWNQTSTNGSQYFIAHDVAIKEVTPYEARITWAEAQYQSSGVVTPTDYSSPMSRGIFRGIERGVA